MSNQLSTLVTTILPLLDLQGLVLSLAMLIPVFSVFLGMLFAMRYHTFYESFDDILLDAGVEGFSPEQKFQLRRVRTMIFTGLGLFVAALVQWMLFGISADGGQVWSFKVACGGLFALDAALLIGALIDMKNGITRPWLRFIVLALGASGVICALIAAISLDSVFGIA